MQKLASMRTLVCLGLSLLLLVFPVQNARGQDEVNGGDGVESSSESVDEPTGRDAESPFSTFLPSIEGSSDASSDITDEDEEEESAISEEEMAELLKVNAPCPSQATVANIEAQARQWDVLEIPLNATSQFENPYKTVTVEATFRGPGNEQKVVQGFWNGGNEYLVRFTPTQPGQWSYSIISKPADGGLTKSGSFWAAEARSGSKGFVRQDPANPHSFVYDSGEHYFMMGNTYYEMVRTACASDLWQEGIVKSKEYGINKIRMLVHGWGLSTDRKANYYPPVFPFVGNNHDRLNLDYWKQLDEVVRFLASQGVNAELILFANSPLSFGSKEQDERYVRYIVARYSAFPNVIWCLANEWEYTLKEKSYWHSIGKLAFDEDPWIKEGEAQRLLSIHNKTGGRAGGKYSYFDSSWSSHAIIQYGVRNGLFRHSDEWGNYSIVQNRDQEMPIVNDEYGYIGETRTMELTRSDHRQAMWAIAVGGGYSAAGDSRTFNDGPDGKRGRVLMTGRWHDAVEYWDIKYMMDFWTTKNIPYWSMTPDNTLVDRSDRIYVLAAGKQEFVVYAVEGRTFSLSLPNATFNVSWYDPRTGETISQPDVTGGGSTLFTKPSAEDWVLHLRRE